MENTKKTSERFPLRLPEDVDTAVRQIARGNDTRPPASINDTIVFLVRQGLKAMQEKQPAPIT